MGASSSGLLDEAKVSNIKGLVDTMFQNFSVFYQDQFPAAFLEHLHQEVEPKKEGRGLLLAQRPQQPSHTLLYQGCVQLSGCDEQVKKCKERYVVLGKDNNVEIHDNKEAFSRGGAAKLVLQTAGGAVFSTEEESRAHLEQSCTAVLKDVKEDSSSVVSPCDAFGVYLHLPYQAATCFLFKQEEERDHFLSAMKTCIRHSNLEPWCDPTYQSQAFIRALQLYRQEKGCYESWEMLLGTEEKVLSCQMMYEMLPCLQRELHSKVKGKKSERIRQWTATMQGTYTLVLDQVTSRLKTLREECHQKASCSQSLIRSDLDQIMTSVTFLEEKVRACVCEEAESVCGQWVAPYISSILEALAEKINAAFSEMQHTLRTHMDAAFTPERAGAEETKKALSALRCTSLEACYRHLEKLPEKLEGLKQRFGLRSSQRLVHSAQLDMEKLLDNAVYTLEVFLQPAAKLQPLCVPVKMAKARERVLKQLDHDSRVLQRRFYQQALLDITLPTLSRKMGSRWKSELRTLEQHIFSDYSSFILVRNVQDEVLRSILSRLIETVVQDAACKKINNVLVDTSDLAISQYSLLGQTPPASAPDSPAAPRSDSSPGVKDQTQPEEVLVEQQHVLHAQHDANTSENLHQDPTPLYPVIVVTQQLNGPPSQEDKTSEEVHLQPTTAESDVRQEAGDPPEERANPEGPEPSAAPPRTNAECFQEPSSPELSAAEHLLESSEQQPSADSLVNIRLGFLSRAIAAPAGLPAQQQQGLTDRAVYLSGEVKDSWEVERVEEQEQQEEQEEARRTGGGEEKTAESAEGGGTEESESVATKEEVEEEKQEVEEEEDNGGRRENCKEEDEEQKKESKEEQEDGGQGGERQEEEAKGKKDDDDGGQGEKEQEESKEEKQGEEEQEEEQKQEEEEKQQQEEQEEEKPKQEEEKLQEEEKQQQQETQQEAQQKEEQNQQQEAQQKEQEEEVKQQAQQQDEELDQQEEKEEQKQEEEEKQQQEEQKQKQEEEEKLQEEQEAQQKEEKQQQEAQQKEEQKQQQEAQQEEQKQQAQQQEEEDQQEEEEEEQKQEEEKLQEEQQEEKQQEQEEEEQKQEEKQQAQQQEAQQQQEEQEAQQQEAQQEEALPHRPLVELQPDGIAAIRALVSEVIEVEVEISTNPDLLHAPPASCDDVAL